MTAVLGRYQGLLLGILSLALITGLWQFSVDAGWINVFFVSTPELVFWEFLAQVESGRVVNNLRVSMYEFAVALALAVGVGVALGMLAGWYRDVEAALEPFIWFKYSAPTIAFYPIFIAWLGYGEPTVIAIAFLFAVTPIYANTLSGIKNADRDLLRAARAFGARPHDLFFRVALPGSVPIMVAGLRLAVGRALTGVVVAELFGASAGLGFSIAYHAQLLQTTRMMVWIVLVIIIGVILTQLLALLEAATETWRTGNGR